MDRGDFLVQQLRRSMDRWRDVIRRSVGASAVYIDPIPGGGLLLTAAWGEHKQYKKTLSRAELFGNTLALTPAAWEIRLRPCDVARSFIRELLERRGVL